MNKNGMQMLEIKSKTELIEGVSDIKSLISERFQSEATAIIYLDYKVLIGIYKDRGFHFYNSETFDDRFIQTARVFDNDKELLIWRTADGFKARMRIDKEGEDTTVVDARQVLFGTRARPLGSEFTELAEDRGTRLIVPLVNLHIDAGKKRLFLYTRNYVGFNEASQAGYVDCRFVAISDKF